MIEKIHEKVSVYSIYDHTTQTTTPRYIKWQNRVYTITKVGLHYPTYSGKVLVHNFSVTDNAHYFLLSFNTQTLSWFLEEIADENSN